MKRRPRAVLFGLLALTFCLNWKLFQQLALPVLCLVAAQPVVGTPFAVLMAAPSVSLRAIGEAASRVPPWVPTPHADMDELLELAGARPGQSFLELGSGDGRNLVRACKAGLHAFGIEASPLLVLISRLRLALSGCRRRASVLRADILEARLPHADLVYAYLSRDTIAAVAPRLSCSSGSQPLPTQLLSRDFGVPGWTPRARSERGRTTLLVYSVSPPPDGAACDAG